MNDNTVVNETITYAAQYMIAKMIEAGKSQAEVEAYMTSEQGIAEVLRLGEKFLNGYVAMIKH